MLRQSVAIEPAGPCGRTKHQFGFDRADGEKMEQVREKFVLVDEGHEPLRFVSVGDGNRLHCSVRRYRRLKELGMEGRMRSPEELAPSGNSVRRWP